MALAFPELTIEDLWQLLAEQHRGVLATIKRDGRPQLSNISYTYDPETRIVRTIAASFRAKTRNLTRDPRASLHISSDDFSRWLVAEGTVTLTPPVRDHEDAVAQEILHWLHADLPADQQAAHFERYPIIDRQLIRLQVDRIYGGNATTSPGVSSS